MLQFGDEDYANDLQIDAACQPQLEAYGKGRWAPAFGAFVERLEWNMTYLELGGPRRRTRQYPVQSHPILSDSLVRERLAHAVDRQAIAALYGPTGQPAANILVSPSVYELTNTANTYSFNLQKAALLLDQAGWVKGPDGIRQKNRLRFSVVYQTSANSVRQQTQQIIAQALTSLGIDVRLTFYDASIFFNSDPSNTHNLHHFYADIQELANGNQSPYPGPYMASWTCGEIAESTELLERGE